MIAEVDLNVRIEVSTPRTGIVTRWAMSGVGMKAESMCSLGVFPGLTPEADFRPDQPRWQTAHAE